MSDFSLPPTTSTIWCPRKVSMVRGEMRASVDLNDA
jgi:hypothetical protein